MEPDAFFTMENTYSKAMMDVSHVKSIIKHLFYAVHYASGCCNDDSVINIHGNNRQGVYEFDVDKGSALLCTNPLNCMNS